MTYRTHPWISALMLHAPLACDESPAGADEAIVDARDGEDPTPPITCYVQLENGKSINYTGPYESLGGGCFERELRLVAPISTSTVTSHRPKFRWKLAPGQTRARIEVCADRGCGTVLLSADIDGSEYQPPSDLPEGTWFFRVQGMSGEVLDGTASHVWQLTIAAQDVPLATNWGSIADFNGDGFADVTIGDWKTQNEDGRAYVYHGAPGGLAKTPSLVLEPAAPAGRFGCSLGSAGDVNGDGFADLVVGALLTDGSGAVYVYFGGKDGVAAVPEFVITGGPDVRAFGYAVASAGDVDGDGFADLVVGAPGSHNSLGRAYVFYGSPVGPLKRSMEWGEWPLGASETLKGRELIEANFGASVASAGDVNGDGFADIVVGEAFAGSYQDNGVHGAAYVYTGGLKGLSKQDALSTTGPTERMKGHRFGFSVAGAGDVNGDGYTDVIVGDWARERAEIFHGGPGAFDPNPDTLLTPPQFTQSFFGYDVATARDIDQDGYTDVIVGETDINALVGRAHVYHGGPGGAAGVDVIDGQPAVGAVYFGNSVQGVGDIDADGEVDVIIGAPGTNGVGAVHLFHTIGGALPATPTLTLEAPVGSNYFGINVGD